MTGPEILAAGAIKKGLEVAGSGLRGGDKEQALVLEATKGTPGYRAAAMARADRMAVKQLAINKLLSPLFWFAGYRRDYFESGVFAADMAAVLVDVSDEDLTMPSPNVVAQAMEGLSYSLDEPDLKAMYLNLLATASDVQRQGAAHPSFAEVIRQLSQPEAALLPPFLENMAGTPMVEIRAVHGETRQYRTLDRHIVDLRNLSTGEPAVEPDWAVFVDNWARLGLVEVDYATERVGEGAYVWTEARPEYLSAQARTDLGDGYSVSCKKGLLKATNFGVRFAQAVSMSGARADGGRAGG